MQKNRKMQKKNLKNLKNAKKIIEIQQNAKKITKIVINIKPQTQKHTFHTIYSNVNNKYGVQS